MAAQSPLLRLPRELRDHVIQFVFEDLDKHVVDFSDHAALKRDRSLPLDLPGLCRTSQQLYFEATPYFLSRITLVLYDIDTICWVRRWLARFPSNSAFHAVRKFAFRNFHGPEQIKGYELMALCPNLRSLKIMFGDEYGDPGSVPSLAIKSFGSSVNAYESLDNIILIHQLHKLADIPKLERLSFGFHDWVQPVSIDRARQVMAWLRVKFQAKGRKVRIECRQMVYGGNPYLVDEGVD